MLLTPLIYINPTFIFQPRINSITFPAPKAQQGNTCIHGCKENGSFTMALTSFTALPMGSLQFNAAKEIQLSMSKQSQEGYDLRDCCRNKLIDLTLNMKTWDELFWEYFTSRFVDMIWIYGIYIYMISFFVKECSCTFAIPETQPLKNL